MKKGLFDEIIKSIVDGEANAEAKSRDNNMPLRDDRDKAKLDYVILPLGNGMFEISSERCKEVGIDPEEAIEKYANLKAQDVADEIGK